MATNPDPTPNIREHQTLHLVTGLKAVFIRAHYNEPKGSRAGEWLLRVRMDRSASGVRAGLWHYLAWIPLRAVILCGECEEAAAEYKPPTVLGFVANAEAIRRR